MAAGRSGGPGFRPPAFVVAILRRLGISLLLLLIISVLIFVACQELPGDVARAMLGQAATDSAVAAIRAKLGLDHPAWLRYLRWLGGALRGDFGTSYTTGQTIAQSLRPRLINSLFLAAVTAVVAVPLSVGLGVVAAVRRDSWPDRLITTLTRASVTLPEFFVAYVLIFVISVKLGWLNSSSSIDPSMSLAARLQAVILPALTLVIAVTGHMTTMTRAALLNVLSAPYIEMAMLKGLPRRKIMLRHALPNAIAPIIGVITVNLSYLITGVVVVEVIFVYPGMGQYLVDSVSRRDVPVVQAAGVVFAAIYILLNGLADLAVLIANPRTRHPR